MNTTLCMERDGVTGCFVGQDVFQRMIGTFGLDFGPRKTFLAVGKRTSCRKTSAKPR